MSAIRMVAIGVLATCCVSFLCRLSHSQIVCMVIEVQPCETYGESECSDGEDFWCAPAPVLPTCIKPDEKRNKANYVDNPRPANPGESGFLYRTQIGTAYCQEKRLCQTYCKAILVNFLFSHWQCESVGGAWVNTGTGYAVWNGTGPCSG